MKRIVRLLLILCALLAPLLLGGKASAVTAAFNYAYNLSDFNGIVPYNAARVFPDNFSEDIFVINGNRVDIYNGRGMQVFDFFLDTQMIVDLAVERGGDILAFVYSGNRPLIARCNYRGELKSQYGLSGIPPAFAELSFNAMRFRGDRLYFVDQQRLGVVVTDLNGAFIKGYNLRTAVLKGHVLSAKELNDLSIGGLDVDDQGSFYFTFPSAGSAAKVAADGTATGFGARGSGASKFGVPEAITVDRKGFIYVCDKLRSVVLVHDKNLKFVTEFGFRGYLPGNLIVPVSVAVGPNGNVYVGQLLDRGVNVYDAIFN